MTIFEMKDDPQSKIEEAIRNPRNLGEMKDADAIGTVGSADCGDMLRMWIKFKEENGRKVIDRATFQSFGCQTAIAVASVATELLKGKTTAEASTMSGEELSAPLGPLPPVKIHCAQLVEGALRNALTGERTQTETTTSPTLIDQLSAATQPAKVLDALGLEKPQTNGASEKTTETGPVDEKAVWEQLKQCYDPEIPVNIVDLGLVYDCQLIQKDHGGTRVEVKMTLTAPGCGMGPAIAHDAQSKILSIDGVDEADVQLVWDPPWNQNMISEAGRMKLGMI